MWYSYTRLRRVEEAHGLQGGLRERPRRAPRDPGLLAGRRALGRRAARATPAVDDGVRTLAGRGLRAVATARRRVPVFLPDVDTREPGDVPARAHVLQPHRPAPVRPAGERDAARARVRHHERDGGVFDGLNLYL